MLLRELLGVQLEQLLTQAGHVETARTSLTFQAIAKLVLNGIAAQISIHEVAVHAVFETPKVAIGVHVRLGLGDETAREVGQRVDLVLFEDAVRAA